MKRTMLLTALLGLVTGAAFAETAPVFSGNFSTYFAYEFGSKGVKDKAENDVKLDLGATIDEWNTVSVSLTTKNNALMWTDKGQDKADTGTPGGKAHVDKDGEFKPDQSNEIGKSDGYLKLGDFTVTTDVLGVLGIDAPVSIKTKVGKFEFKTVNVANVAAKSTKKVGGNGTAKGVGIGVDVTLLDDMVTIGTGFYPKSAAKGKLEKLEAGISVKATGILDMVDAAFYLINSGYDTGTNDAKNKFGIKDENGANLGVSFSLAAIDGLKLGLGVNYDLSVFAKKDKDAKGTDIEYTAAPGTFDFQGDVAFTMIDRLNVGLSAAVTDFGKKDFKIGKGFESWISAGYDVFDNLSIGLAFGSTGLLGILDSGFKAASLKSDVAVTASFDGLKVRVGYSNDSDFKAPEKDFDHALYLKFSTSF